MTERKTLQLRDPSEGADAAPVLKKKGRGWEISDKRLDVLHEQARELRLRASDVLQALLLECEIGQFRLVQQLAAAQGALLWLLPLCFVGGALVSFPELLSDI